MFRRLDVGPDLVVVSERQAVSHTSTAQPMAVGMYRVLRFVLILLTGAILNCINRIEAGYRKSRITDIRSDPGQFGQGAGRGTVRNFLQNTRRLIGRLLGLSLGFVSISYHSYRLVIGDASGCTVYDSNQVDLDTVPHSWKLSNITAAG